jgi:predicted AAA+ superfamily ATPase
MKSEKRELSWETINNYVDYCKNACLLLPAERENIGGKELLRVNEKIYISDHGLREAFVGGNRENIQQILENIVFLELQRRDWTVSVGKIGTAEVDFIAHRPGETAYYQVCYLLAESETIEREFAPLLAIQDNYPKFVLSLDTFDLSRKGITHKNIRDWLLEG